MKTIMGVLLSLGLLAACSSSSEGLCLGEGTFAECGGSPAVYESIRAETDCSALQETFDRAAGNNDRATPGTAEHRWTLGYMKAAEAQRQSIGC